MNVLPDEPRWPDFPAGNGPLLPTPAEIIIQELIASTERERSQTELRSIRSSFRRLPRCKHKFHQGELPRHKNCEPCWFAFFQVHGEVTRLADQIFRDHGEQALVAQQGRKFTEMFVRFMAGLAIWKRQLEEKQGTNGITTVEP